ncbi:MFS transporter [Kocuria dechangensis]|uniref:MFS transporter n=1 Tax=Kocuria dechangensis TaxID=1176249 RepID=A0A917GYU4_9MICC|nr:MFS transporter [Kocuria dechangensis]GGG61700.1 MFS transporter [Kocuria dechangensis]
MAQASQLTAPAVDPQRQRKAKKATGVAAFGTFIEYYDFSVFGYVAATIAVVFFPSDDPVAGLLNTFLIFGTAFIVRPLGAIFFGWIGDRMGRRTSLVGSILLMSAAAGFIAALPTYAQIGIWAPILLGVLRMLQGFSAGGEIGGAASYIREWAPIERRNLYISFIPSIAVLGKGSAAGLAALAATLVPAEAMESWGWRIPFMIAVPLGILCLIMRLKIEDSPEFTASATTAKETTGSPFGRLIGEHRKPLTKVFFISLVQNMGTYIGTVYVAVYFSTVLGYTKAEASYIVLIAVVAAAFLIPLAGQLGNRIGAKRVLVSSYLFYIVVTIPSFMLMNNGSVALAMVGLLIGMVPYALCQAGTYASMPEFFPVEVRHTGVAFGHSVGAVIGGAGGPYFATWMIDATGNTLVPAYMLVVFGVMGLAVVLGAVRTNTTTSSTSHLYR